MNQIRSYASYYRPITCTIAAVAALTMGCSSAATTPPSAAPQSSSNDRTAVLDPDVDASRAMDTARNGAEILLSWFPSSDANEASAADRARGYLADSLVDRIVSAEAGKPAQSRLWARMAEHRLTVQARCTATAALPETPRSIAVDLTCEQTATALEPTPLDVVERTVRAIVTADGQQVRVTTFSMSPADFTGAA
ncbi:hypothetical protein AYK61_26000 [Rhodococcus sp. SBT000017]|uniref:hypothetical protein n=1 Tax=Rhodococcus sp. SBT000017 TaxID=1803385 RepID=UPI000EF89A87|nr:hypothetical protein [Rhodococcus sp. SBT000017]RMB70191.1 hypothetical protein AYK61_26000 [Rhodococcus sp. SBT000017]